MTCTPWRTYISLWKQLSKNQFKLIDYFSDTDTLIKSGDMLKRLVGFDPLDKKKHFGLKKHIATLRIARVS